MSTEVECPNCCKKYKKRGNLIRHLRMSFDCSVGEPWQCMHCQRYFNCKKNLENHVRQRHAYECHPDLAVRLIQVHGADHLFGVAPERGQIYPDAEFLTRQNEHQEINRVLQNRNSAGNLLVLIIDRNQTVSSNLHNSQRSEHNQTLVNQSNERSQEMDVDVNQNNVGEINKRSFSQIEENQKDTNPVNEITLQSQNISISGQTQERILKNHENFPITVKNERVQENTEDETENSERTIVSFAKESERLQENYEDAILPSKISEHTLNQTFLISNKISDTQESIFGNTTVSVKTENTRLESEVNETNDDGSYFVRNEEPPYSKKIRLSIIKTQSNKNPAKSINEENSCTQASIKQEFQSESIEDNRLISELCENSQLNKTPVKSINEETSGTQASIKQEYQSESIEDNRLISKLCENSQSNKTSVKSINEENSGTQASIKQEYQSESIEDNQLISELCENSETVLTDKEFLICLQLLEELPGVSNVINGHLSETVSSSEHCSTVYDPLSQSFIDDTCVLDNDLNIFRTVLLGNDQLDNINVAVFLKRLKKTFFDIIEDSLKQHDKLKLNFELILDIALCDETDIFDIQTQSFETNLADHHLGDDIHLFINSVYKSMLHRLESDMSPNTAIIEIKHLEINIAHHMPKISVKKNLF